MADYDDIHWRHNDLVAYEAARTHARWIEAFREQYHPKTAELIERGEALSEADYRRALDGRPLGGEAPHRGRSDARGREADLPFEDVLLRGSQRDPIPLLCARVEPPDGRCDDVVAIADHLSDDPCAVARDRLGPRVEGRRRGHQVDGES